MHVRTWAPLLGALSIAMAGTAFAAISSAEVNRLHESAQVVRELRDAQSKVPDDLWNKAECVVVIPSMKKAAFVFGGEYGRGVMSCRRAGTWSAPLFMTLAKGSWGLQIGAEQVDLILLVMNQHGVDKLLQDNVSLGADASVAAGPVGRTGAAGTDAQFSAEILSYSRSQGVFAGIDLSGGVLKPDKDSNKDVYGGNHESSRDIVMGQSITVPTAANDFVRALSSEARATSGRK